MYDEDKSTYKVTAKYNYEEGVLEIDIPAIIAKLSTEDREELAKLHAWDSAMWEELKHCIRTDLTSSYYNGVIHKLRIELLGGEDADPILKRTVRGILWDLKCAKRNQKYYEKKFHLLKRWCKHALSRDQRKELAMIKREDISAHIKNKEIEEAIKAANK